MQEVFEFEGRNGEPLELTIKFRQGKRRGWIAWVDGHRPRGVGCTRAEARNDLLRYDEIANSAQPIEDDDDNEVAYWVQAEAEAQSIWDRR